MAITKEASLFYKEAMEVENYYRNSMLVPGILCLLLDGYINDDDLSELPDGLKSMLNEMLSNRQAIEI